MKFDESYGISGRLLIGLYNINARLHSMECLAIGSDLKVLSDLLMVMNDNINNKELQLKAKIYYKIYEFCYGTQFMIKYFNQNDQIGPILKNLQFVDTESSINQKK